MHAERWPDARRGQGNWTKDRVELLRKLLEQRLSARVVALRLGGVTRNAVIGKAKREGFALQPPTSPPLSRYIVEAQTSAPRKRRVHVTPDRITQNVTPRVRIAPTFPAEPVVIHEDIYVAPENRKGVLALTESDCKWPIGDPREADFHFCGGPRVPGMPYCEGHCKRAYQSSQEIATRQTRAMRKAA
jgi:GcrA cell cycle regulator